MSKICVRNYDSNSMLSVKPINGIACCTLCEKPAVCHGKPIYQRALYWYMAGNTGVSSETIARHMTGYKVASAYSAPPSDADDRKRCIQLLELIPEWIERLPELTQQEKPSNSIVIGSSGISSQSRSWAEQIPLILKEGKL